MIHCISQKMSPQDFEGHDETSKAEMLKTKTDRNRYYEKLGSAMFGVCLPGLGYDTFRMWELLTMGTVIILERAVGFDRTVNLYMIEMALYFLHFEVSILQDSLRSTFTPNHFLFRIFLNLPFSSLLLHVRPSPLVVEASSSPG